MELRKWRDCSFDSFGIFTKSLVESGRKSFISKNLQIPHKSLFVNKQCKWNSHNGDQLAHTIKKTPKEQISQVGKEKTNTHFIILLN